MTRRARSLCVVLAAVTWFAVGGVFHLAVPRLFPVIPSQFENSALYRPWAGWTSTYMALHPLWYAPLFALTFLWLRRRGLFSGLDGGFAFGLAMFWLGGLPGYLLSYASFQMSFQVLMCWLFQSLCQHVITGVVLSDASARLDAGTDSHHAP